MDTITIINRAVVSLGIPTIAAVLIYIGRKMQVLDSLEKAIEKEIKPDLKRLKKDIERVDTWMMKYSKSSI